MKESTPCSMRERAAKIIEKTSDHCGVPGEHDGLSGLSRFVRRELQQQPARENTISQQQAGRKEFANSERPHGC